MTTNRTADPSSMWGVAELFEELCHKSLDFLELLFLKVQQFEIRIRSHALGAAEHLSPFIGENIPEKRTGAIFMILIFTSYTRLGVPHTIGTSVTTSFIFKVLYTLL